jgi:HD-like signal output (HDOD) protein
MEKQQLTMILQNYIHKLPPLSPTVGKILQVCNDPRTSPVDLNQVIGLDPVLMGKVMRLINSAYYSLPNQVTSLVRAIIMLGINTVKNLALSTAVLGSLGKQDNFQALNMEGFWRHSICTGVTAKMIAARRKVDSKLREEYFIAGLLHDVGKIPLNNRLSKLYLEAVSLTDREHLPLSESEARVLGIDHQEAGRLVIENWKLGASIGDVVTFHHRLAEYAGQYWDLLATVAAANYFANTFEIGFSGDRYPARLPDGILEKLGISLEYLEGIEEAVNGEIEKAQIFLKVL